jgi:hypothetical protein
MNISRLEGELLEAQARYNAMQHASLEQWREAEAALLRAERAFSMAKGEETALACEWKVRWEPNAPMPHVLASEVQTYLMYVVQEDANWDGSSEKLSIALVNFIDCYAWKHYLLSFRDETFECLASDYQIELFTASLGQVAQIAHMRLFANESR